MSQNLSFNLILKERVQKLLDDFATVMNVHIVFFDPDGVPLRRGRGEECSFFCKKMQNTPKSYDYWNGIATVISSDGTRRDGAINKTHYSYNSGSMILANLAMYDAVTDETKKAMYMEDAINTAAAAKKTFYRMEVGNPTRYYIGDPWFAAILNEAYYELAGYDKALGASYLETFAKNVKLGYGNRDEATKLLPYQAVWKVDPEYKNREDLVLMQVGFVQQAVMAALYSIEIK